MDLINKDGFLLRKKARIFIRAVYDYANGRINHINKSNYLKFTELKSGDPSHPITGERKIDHIEIDLDSIELFTRISHYGDEQEEQVRIYHPCTVEYKKEKT